MRLVKFALLFLALIVTVSGCSSIKTTKDQRDPFESYNRKVYALNDNLYYVLTPVATCYDYLVPDFVKNGIFNVFQNLLEPARVANDILQGQWSYAGDDSIRFLTNTTFGLLGFFDVADSWFDKEMRYHQGFALTLHKWGFYNENEVSPYVVWPLLGPGTLEDIANSVDAVFNPLTYVLFFAPVGNTVSHALSWGVYGSYQFNQGVAYLPAYSNLKSVSVDPYVAMRNAYLQNYDYVMAKVFKQDSHLSSHALETDKAVFGVLGLDAANADFQVASSGNVSKYSDSTNLFKSKLPSINKAFQINRS